MKVNYQILEAIFSRIGYFIQAYILISIHLAVYFEITIIDDYLISISTYERSFNHLTGWPLYTLTMFYYFKTSVVRAGIVRNNWDLYCIDDRVLKKCKVCNVSKPLRTTHCRFCNICVPIRDHHFIFTNNCVGHANFKSFSWFTFFGFFGTLHFLIRALQWEYEWCFGNDLTEYNIHYPILLWIHIHNMTGFLILLLFIWIRSCRNVIYNTNQKFHWLNNKCWKTNENNFFHLGIIQNWIITFGVNPILWFTPESTKKYAIAPGPEFPTWPE